MPIYEYHCNACDKDFEAWQKITETTSDCEACGSPDTRRKVSATSFVLKGSGWYKTDYATKPATTTKDGDTGSKGEAAGNGKADAASGADKSEKGDKSEKAGAPAKAETPAPKAAAAS